MAERARTAGRRRAGDRAPRPAAAAVPTGRRARSTGPRGALARLTTDAANARAHTPRNLELIRAALTEVGAGRSVVIDETGRVLAGNATVAEARALGLRLKVVDTDAGTLVAVRRRDLTAAQKTRLALFDNRAAELAPWKVDVLSGLRASGELLAGLWTPGELARELGEPAGAQSFVAFKQTGKPKYRCPSCGTEWSGQPRPGEVPPPAASAGTAPATPSPAAPTPARARRTART